MFAIRPLSRVFLSILALTGGVALAQSPASLDLAPLMPREEDRTRLWWRDGFPGTIEGAPPRFRNLRWVTR